MVKKRGRRASPRRMAKNNSCSSSMHAYVQHKGKSLLFLGILILLNANYMWLTWDYFIGIAFILVALCKLIRPHMHCHC